MALAKLGTQMGHCNVVEERGMYSMTASLQIWASCCIHTIYLCASRLPVFSCGAWFVLNTTDEKTVLAARAAACVLCKVDLGNALGKVTNR